MVELNKEEILKLIRAIEVYMFETGDESKDISLLKDKLIHYL
jgi:hypothetical protein